jgi:hypothetical protein
MIVKVSAQTIREYIGLTNTLRGMPTVRVRDRDEDEKVITIRANKVQQQHLAELGFTIIPDESCAA